jgi:hypothetical protein
MALFDNPPHRVSLSRGPTSEDSAGGVNIDYTIAQADIPCIINTASASTVQMYAQEQMPVSMTIGIKSSVLATTPQPGWKATTDDTGRTAKIVGIRSGRPMGTIPALTYLDVSQFL